MTKTGFPKFLLILSIMLSGISPVFAQLSPPQIINHETSILNSCSDSILIAPEISIQNIVVNDASEGLKISILNYKSGEDTLVYTKLASLNYSWNNNGSLEITGLATAEEYQAAVRKVYYKNLTDTLILESRTIIISLLDVDYFPKTQHFYRYIKDLNITWKDAKATTDTMQYYGLQGYLATVMSKEENDFIWTKVDGIGWIGASDEENEGEWKWVTGPETGQQFWQGDASGYTVNGLFAGWAEGEPNNAFGGQQFAHYNQHPDKAPKSWNDLKNDGSDSDPQYYTPQGFVVEFGGMPGDPVVNLSATVHVQLNPVPTVGFDIDDSNCINNPAEVNYLGSATERDSFIWDLSDFEPREILQFPGNSKGPLVFKRSSAMTVDVGIRVISEFGCESESFTKTFNRKPLVEVQLDKTEGCPPLSIYFLANSIDKNDSIKYTWDFGDGNSGTGDKVSNNYTQSGSEYNIQVIAMSMLTGCADTLMLEEQIRTLPAPIASFTANPAEVFITDPVINFNNKSENAILYEWEFGDFSATSSEENPQHRFQIMGNFDIHLIAYNEFGCEDVELQKVTVGFDKVFPPTVFSPNASLWEDQEFRIYAEGISNEGYEMKIYNRWGENIFTSNSQETGWNGRMKNGKYAPTGIYTWIIQYNDFLGKSHKQQGNVTLLF